MKIAHIVSTYPPYKGGMGNVAASFVAELQERGHDCTVFVPQYRKVDDQKDIVRIKPLLKYGNAGFIPQLYKYLDNFDVIHLHYPFFGGAETVYLYKKLHPKKPLIITFHMDVIGSGVVKLISSLYRKVIHYPILKSADIITCSSKDYASYSQMKEVIDSRFIELPFGTDFQGRPKLLSGKNKLLFVGGLDSAHAFKGVDILLKAVSKLED